MRVRKNDDVYISILKILYNHSISGVTLEEMYSELVKNKKVSQEIFDLAKIKVEDNEEPATNITQAKTKKARLRTMIDGAGFQLNKMGGYWPDQADENRKYVLSVESHYRLLEHIELEESRKTSRLALILSTAAIIISVLTSAVSWWIGTKPIELKETQYQTLKPIQYDLSEINSRLDRIESKISPQIEQKPEISPVPERK